MSPDDLYVISFEYYYSATREFNCEDGNTGDSCEPQSPYRYPHKYAKIINVDGYDLVIPIYIKESEELSIPLVAQLVPGADNQVLDRMNFLNNPRGISDYNQDFRILLENPYDEDLWKKEIEPALIHALETFEIKDLKKQKPE